MKKIICLIILLILLGCKKEKVEVDLSRPLVVVGDSLAAGYGSANGFPYYLEKGMNLEVVNLGKNGQTTNDALKTYEEVVAYDPSIVIIELGGNDFLKRIPTMETEINLANLIEELDNGERPIFLTEFYPNNNILGFFFRLPKKEYDDMFKRLSKKENVYLIKNIWKDVWKKEMSDEVHPNSEGYKLMGRNIIKDMKKVISKETFKEIDA